MQGTIWHCHIAVSLDGKIARPDGSVEDWLVADYPAEDFGFPAFLSSVDGMVMGRATYDAVRRMGDWPYAGKPAVVLTSRTLDDAPAGVEARSGDIDALIAAVETRGWRRVWIVGGGRVLRDLIAAGRLDVLEMAVIPIVLGSGIPLFPPGTPELALVLARCDVRTKGALHVVYHRAGAFDPVAGRGFDAAATD